MLDNKTKEAMQDKFWTPELWCEFLEGYSYSSGIDLFKAAEQFKSSKSPKKEWEIVVYRTTNRNGENPRYWDLVDGGLYKVRDDNNNSKLGPDHFTDGNIFSVRRLSDGEVFSEKDWVKTSGSSKRQITGFSIVENGLLIHFDNGSLNIVPGGPSLGRIEKLPQPILTTVDGVEIFDLDIFRPTILFDDGSMNTNCDRKLWDNDFAKQHGKLFTSREAAEKWMIENKPLISLNDVKEICEHASQSVALSYLFHELTALVKQKMNDKGL